MRAGIQRSSAQSNKLLLRGMLHLSGIGEQKTLSHS
jgi:hypothetical protein